MFLPYNILLEYWILPTPHKTYVVLILLITTYKIQIYIRNSGG